MIRTRENQRVLCKTNLLQVCSTDKGEPESVIVDESSTEGSESESAQKSINTNEEKYVIYEIEHEEHLITDNLVIKETRYLNLFKCGKNLFNRLDSTRKQVCMEN